jgi:hypothetical protein
MIWLILSGKSWSLGAVQLTACPDFEHFATNLSKARALSVGVGVLHSARAQE